MIFKKDLQRKIQEQAYRIRELEERICPTQSHEWVKVGSVFAPVCVGDDSTRDTWQCRKCGKVVSTYDALRPQGGKVVEEP